MQFLGSVQGVGMGAWKYALMQGVASPAQGMAVNYETALGCCGAATELPKLNT